MASPSKSAARKQAQKARKSTRKEQRASVRELKKSQRAANKAVRADQLAALKRQRADLAIRRRELRAEYKRKLKELDAIGAYAPKGGSKAQLTPYRKGRINKAWAEFGSTLSDKRHPSFFVPAPTSSPAAKKRFLSEAKALDIKTTPTGILYVKGGHTKARVKYDIARDEYDVILSGKVKHGDRRGKQYVDKVPIAPLDRISGERARLQSAADSFGPLKRGEQISFVLVENNKEVGASRTTFHSADRLMEYLDRNYHRDNKAAKLAFLRLVVVQKTTLVDWSKDHPPAKKRMAQRGKNLGYRPH